MKKTRSKSIAYLGILLILLTSCSTEKNTVLSRRYHAMLTRFNIGFNGTTAYQEGIENIQKSNKDDFSDIIHIYPISNHENANSAKGDMDRAIEKCRKAIKLHSIKKKPKKNYQKLHSPTYKAFYGQNEFNPALKKAWLMLGKAEFHKGDFLGSIGTFKYIARLYQTDENMVVATQLWIARAYTELDWLYDAEDVLHKINQEKISAQQTKLFADAWATLLIKQKMYKKAIPYVEIAIENEKVNKQKVRYYFVMAQLLEKTNQKKEAATYYGKVIARNPSYEFDFNARINRSQLSNENPKKIEKELHKMAKNYNNKDFLDQIYTAIGNVFLNAADTTNAIKYYQLAIEKSTRNGVEKGVALLKLGRMYFQDQKYIKAAPYYNEASKIYTKTYPDFEIINHRAEILSELLKENQIVVLQDSLQRLSTLPEKERLEAIDRVIEKIEKEEKQQEEKEIRSQQPPQEQFAMPMQPIGRGSNNWYFYNPTSVSNGKTEFRRKWGNRKLEDNWRRRNKSMQLTDEQNTENQENKSEQEKVQNDSTQINQPKTNTTTDIKSVDYYLAQIPFTEQQKQTSNLQIADALYNMGFIYKEKIEDFALAYLTFEQFQQRFGSDERVSNTIFQQFLMASKEQNNTKATRYRELILNQYPQSKYAKLLADPNYILHQQKTYLLQDSIYNQTYQAYTQNKFKIVFDNTKYVQKHYPTATLLPQFELLNTLSIGKTLDSQQFEIALNLLVKKHPNTDISTIAKDILALLNQGMVAQKGKTHGSLLAKREVKTKENITEKQQQLSNDLTGKHRLLLISKADNQGFNKLQYQLAIFNFSRFMIKNFQFSMQKVDDKKRSITIDNLSSYQEALWYQNTLATDSSIIDLMDSLQVQPIAISEKNFDKIQTSFTLQDYLKFEQDSLQANIPKSKQYAAFVRPKTTQKVDIIDGTIGLEISKTEDNKNNTNKTIQNNKTTIKKDTILYKNLYLYQPDKPHHVVLYILSNSKYDYSTIKKNLDQFDQDNYKIINLKVSEKSNGEQSIVSISQFESADIAKSYLLRMLKDKNIKNATNGINKRNLIITQKNLEVLLKNKNIDIYLEFMKNYYFK